MPFVPTYLLGGSVPVVGLGASLLAGVCSRSVCVFVASFVSSLAAHICNQKTRDANIKETKGLGKYNGVYGFYPFSSKAM